MRNFMTTLKTIQTETYAMVGLLAALAFCVFVVGYSLYNAFSTY